MLPRAPGSALTLITAFFLFVVARRRVDGRNHLFSARGGLVVLEEIRVVLEELLPGEHGKTLPALRALRLLHLLFRHFLRLRLHLRHPRVQGLRVHLRADEAFDVQVVSHGLDALQGVEPSVGIHRLCGLLLALLGFLRALLHFSALLRALLAAADLRRADEAATERFVEQHAKLLFLLSLHRLLRFLLRGPLLRRLLAALARAVPDLLCHLVHILLHLLRLVLVLQSEGLVLDDLVLPLRFTLLGHLLALLRRHCDRRSPVASASPGRAAGAGWDGDASGSGGEGD